MKREEAVDPRLQLLIDRHRYLDIEADTLSCRRYLLPEERERLSELKYMRLYAKRAIDYYLEYGTVEKNEEKLSS